jgi:hypothetical protein
LPPHRHPQSSSGRPRDATALRAHLIIKLFHLAKAVIRSAQFAAGKSITDVLAHLCALNARPTSPLPTVFES